MLPNRSTGLMPEMFFKAVNGRITFACRRRSRGEMIPARAGPGKSTRSAMADDTHGPSVRLDLLAASVES